MFTRRNRASDDRGMTLVEVLVSIFILSLVGTIIASVVIASIKSTRSTASGVEGQAELNDAVSRISRDIAASDPILWTAPSNGWTTPSSPAVTDLWMQTTANDKCVRTRYYVEVSGTNKSLKSETRTFSTAACPDPRLPDNGGTASIKTVIKDLKTTANDGVTPVSVFTYYDRNNTELTTVPLSRSDVARIARIKIDVGANVRDRKQGVRLSTSVAPNDPDFALVTGEQPVTPAPACGTFTAVSNGASPQVPTVSWTNVANATGYELRRTAPTPATLTTTTGGSTFTDTAMSGTYSTNIAYQLIVTGPGGGVTCTANLTMTNTPTTPAPTCGTFTAVSNGASPQVPTVSWGAVSNATSYALRRTAPSAANLTTTSGGSAFTDTAMSGTYGTNITYQLVITGSGGSVTCTANLTMTSTPTTPAPTCGTFTAVSNGASPSSPTVSWGATANATSYALRRTAPSTATLTTTSGGSTFTDSAMSGTYGTNIAYALDISGPGGSVTCTTNLTMTAPPSTPAPSCANANLQAVKNAASPPSPTVSWSSTPNATSFTLRRTTPSAANLTTTSTNPNSYTDSGMAGNYGVNIAYALDISGPGGSVTCTANLTMTNTQPPSLGNPTLSATVTPDTSSTAQTVGTSSVNLSWPAVNTATGYRVYRRPITSADYQTASTCDPATWTLVTTTASTSYSQAPGFDTAWDYCITAYNATSTSNTSNVIKALTHTAASGLSGVPVTYRQNRVSWSAASSPTLAGYTIFSRPNGTSTWTNRGTVSSATTSFTDTVALGTLTDYMLTPYNSGPRGTQYPNNTSYFGTPSAVVTVLQYPPTPTTTVTGTENGNNPTGTNTATWNSVATATSYKVIEADSPTGAATTTTAPAASMSRSDAGNPRGSRNFYAAVACNATGCSENEGDANIRATNGDFGYQRPDNITPVVGNVEFDGCDDVGEVTNNQVFNCASREAVNRFTKNAAAGDPSDNFCAGTNEGSCRYVSLQSHVERQTIWGDPATSQSNFTMTHGTSQSGETIPIGVIACNKGGCSLESPVDVRAYPGDFNIDFTFHPESYRNTDGSSSVAAISATWTQSVGVRSASNAFGATRNGAIDDRYSRNTATTTYGPSASERQFTRQQATPGAVYTQNITAYAANGLRRTNGFTVQIPPATPTFIQSADFCKTTTMNRGWKTLYKFRKGARDNAGAFTYANQYRSTEYLFRWNTLTPDGYIAKFTAIDYLGDTGWTGADSTSWPVGVEMYRHQFDTASAPQNDNGLTADRLVGPTTLGADFEMTSNQLGSGAMVGIRSIVNRTGSHYTDYGFYDSVSSWQAVGAGNTPLRGTKTDGSSFTGCGSTYTAVNNRVNRAANPQDSGNRALTGVGPTDWAVNGG